MCGICGVHYLGARPEVEREKVARMNQALFHRGPDEEGYYYDAGVGFGHRRLSIIDLDAGRQPISNEDGTVSIVYNGETYNYLELRAYLESKGHRFKTNTDTEVIVHLYEEYGPECARRLNGMFAFAIWDKKRRRLMLARDRLGIKPLYWAVKGGALFFASELKALLTGLEGPQRVNREALCRYLLLQYTPGPETIIEGVWKLPPASMLTVEDGGRHRVDRYWDAREIPADKEGGPYDGKALLSVLDRAVEAQLVSDVPLGAFLSGGVDSSAVVALMKRHKAGPVKTFSVGFEGPAAFDERRYARRAAEYLGTEHHETVLTPEDFVEYAPRVFAAMDEPVADPAAIPTYKLSEFARRHVKVVMTGEGGDELFGGYRRYFLEDKAGASLTIPYAGRLAESVARLSGRRHVKAVRALSSRRWAEAHLNWVTVFIEEELEALTGGSCDGAWEGAVSMFEARAGQGGSRLGKMLQCDLVTWLPEDLLAKVDRMSMAVSLEARVPYLDHNLVEAALAYGTGGKIRGMTTKYMLKKALKGVLPDDIIERKKKGFDLPLAAWFRGPLREYLRESVGPAASGSGYFDGGFVRRILDEHDSGRSDWSLPLFSLLAFSRWSEGLGV